MIWSKIRSEGSCNVLLLKVGQFSLRIYCLLTYFVTTCLILEIKGVFSFFKKSFFWFGIIICRHEPWHTQIQTQIHTQHNMPSPLGEQPLDEPGIPVYQMCQLVIFSLHLIGVICLKKRMNETKTGDWMPNGAEKSENVHSVSVCVFFKPHVSLYFCGTGMDVVSWCPIC